MAAPAGLLRLEVAFAPASDGPAGALGISRMDGYEAEQPGGRRAWWGRVGGPPVGVRAAAQAVLEHGPAADICFVSEVGAAPGERAGGGRCGWGGARGTAAEPARRLLRCGLPRRPAEPARRLPTLAPH